MRSLLFSWKISMRSFIVFSFSSFSFFLSFFFVKNISFIQWEKFAFFILFLEKPYAKKYLFTYRKKQEKTIFFNVLILLILSSITEYCKHFKTLTNVFVMSHTSIEWNVTLKFLNSKELLPLDKHYYRNKWLEWDHCPNIVFNIYPYFT